MPIRKPIFVTDSGFRSETNPSGTWIESHEEAVRLSVPILIDKSGTDFLIGVVNLSNMTGLASGDITKSMRRVASKTGLRIAYVYNPFPNTLESKRYIHCSDCIEKQKLCKKHEGYSLLWGCEPRLVTYT